MKYVAILLTLVLVACLAGTAYLYLTCEVTVEALGVTATEAASQRERLAELQVGEDLTGYVLYTWRIRVKNTTFVELDELQALAALQPGDVCQLDAARAWKLAPRSEGELEITVLTRVNTTPVRDATVSWYLWGQPTVRSLTLR